MYMNTRTTGWFKYMQLADLEAWCVNFGTMKSRRLLPTPSQALYTRIF